MTLHKPKEEAQSSPQDRDGKLVSIQVLADILGVPKSWIYDKTRRGPEAIPHVRMGKYVRFDPQEVIQFFEAKAAAR
ncbi:MAG: helix-turn-helix domain-containing protein [Candidatus Omnitrophica bacterium]|nr:helix-turn-helix domain-containing protein [Candidatus Omnitrophota bacterium]